MTRMASDREAALVDGLRRRLPEAFDEVYEFYRPRLFAFLLRLSRSRTVAEDLLDETWLRLVAHAPDLRPDTRLAAWLFTVARNLYWTERRSWLRAEALEPALPGLWPAAESWPSPFELASLGELERRVERALATLSPTYREVLLLVTHQGLTPSEAAAACNVTPEALRQRLARARAALGDALGLPRSTAVTARRYGT
jgi:RNA polymerase sigma-70 factor (ECF subfamily)